MNEQQLRAMAGNEPKDEFLAKYGAGLPEGVKEARDKMKKEVVAKAAEEAARFFISMETKANRQQQDRVKQIRELNKSIDDYKKSMRRLDAAMDFGAEKNNWLVAAQLTGAADVFLNEQDNKEFEDYLRTWSPKKETVSTPAAST